MARKAKLDTVSVQLAPNAQIPFDDERIPYPDVLASNKLDGNRVFIRAGELLTRNMLPQPNKHLSTFFEKIVAYSKKKSVCFDGELLIPNATHHGVHGHVFNSHENPIPPTTQLHVFDTFSLYEWESREITLPFEERVEEYRRHLRTLDDMKLVPMKQIRVANAEEAKALFDEAVRAGLEGIMLRNAKGLYKQGRCGHKGAWLLKFKHTVTEDCVILEVLQQLKMRHGIERTRNAYGRLEQPTKNADNYAPTDSCAGFRVRMEDGTEGEVCFGAGFANMEERARLWKIRSKLIGRTVEVVAYPGAKDSIRSGRVIKWRPDKDKK